GGKNSLNRLIRCVCGKKIGPDPRNFNQRVSLGRNDLLIRTFPRFEQNTAKEIEVSVRRFEQSGVIVKGCILNGIIKKASSYYSYGYNHYGYTYTDNKK
ncbi:hypothetical protein AAB982_26685, partial [Klebsiella pneumoniae]|uniref:hypothetical protein n=1 Tax=Klebsiella pneumoniae TaxID=573 RepID=UPI00311E3B18